MSSGRDIYVFTNKLYTSRRAQIVTERGKKSLGALAWEHRASSEIETILESRRKNNQYQFFLFGDFRDLRYPLCRRQAGHQPADTGAGAGPGMSSQAIGILCSSWIIAQSFLASCSNWEQATVRKELWKYSWPNLCKYSLELFLAVFIELSPFFLMGFFYFFARLLDSVGVICQLGYHTSVVLAQI